MSDKEPASDARNWSSDPMETIVYERTRADKAEAEVARHEQRIKDYENEPGWREIVAERTRAAVAQRDALLRAIEKQPHSGRCAVYTSSGYCDCWKAAAIKEASHE